MIAYSIFDDFSKEAINILSEAGIEVTVHPKGIARPVHDEMKAILENYDCVIIGTSQKISSDQFQNINSPKIIGTASVGIDHIQIPADKKDFIKIVNAPTANAQSVAEYTIGCALLCCKRILEGCGLYKRGLNNKKLYQKPEDLIGKTMGVIGAGNISEKIMDYAIIMGMKVFCWTRHPENHANLKEKGVTFCKNPEEIAECSDYISVNLPNVPETVNLISAGFVGKMKSSAVFISVSRLETVDFKALFEKASMFPSFYVCLDLDQSENVRNKIPELPNVIVTPHIAGGTVETRKRLFAECAQNIVRIVAEKY